MTVSLSSFVDIYVRALDAAAHLLARGEAFASEQGMTEADLLGLRLAEDMHPLSFQVGTVVNFSRSWIARAADLSPPEGITAADLDLAGLKAAIAQSHAFLTKLDPAALAGRDEVALTVQITDTLVPTLPVERWIASFATTNIHFHLSMIYAILRHHGVPLGKIDLFPTGL